MGFVSNSSSSSFVIIGVSLNKLQYEKIDKNLLDNGNNYLSDSYGPGFLGKVIMDNNNEDYLECGAIDIDLATKEAIKTIEECGLKKEDIKIIYGTRGR
jgi:hypothetical protein